MIEFITANLWLFWTIIVFICLILELSSGDFYITCFAVGGLVAIATALFDLPFWLQVIIWAVCSILSIRLIRPLLLKRLHRDDKERVSNIDAIIGRVGTVVEKIEPDSPGYVKIDGDEWKAVTEVAETIEKGVKVKIVSRDSIIVTVERV